MNPNYQTLGPILKLESVSLSFKKDKGGCSLILRDINVEILDIVREQTTGQVGTIVGRSGIGKTQLLKIISGLQEPTTGSILVGPEQKPVKYGEVGMVLQTYPLFEHRTLISNLELVCKDKSRVEHLMEEFSISDHKDKYPCQLSGGQRQRAAIVQQLLCSDNFILLDEPFSGLDPVATEKLCENIARVAAADSLNTVLISSHILEPSMAISDTVWQLGYEFDANGQKIEGATIRKTYDLAGQGLAWRPNIKKDPHFIEVCEEVRAAFLGI